jgi:hypothetical protein
MSVERQPTPAGYTSVRHGDTDLVALTRLVPVLTQALSEGTLYEYAAHHTEARPLQGRGVAYAVPLPDGATNVVVRRSRHGGLLAPVTGELFLGGTRAPRELETSLRLGRLAIPTPQLVAFATYAAAPMLRRADVVTLEVPRARDLAEYLLLMEDADERRPALEATAVLLARMAEGGVRHPDLNLKNVLLAVDDNARLEANLLDVDRVWFDEPAEGRVLNANLRRLFRSARKWRTRHGLPISEEELGWLADEVGRRIDSDGFHIGDAAGS